VDLRWDEATMECERIREEFVERLTGTLDPARLRAIDDHLSGCAACRAETERLRELWAELATLNVPAAASGAGRIERMIDARTRLGAGVVSLASRPERRTRARQIAFSVVGLAVSLFIGMALGHRSTNAARDTVVPMNITPASETKQKYVLLLHGPARARPLTQPTAADSAAERAIVAEYSAWARGLATAGSLVMAEKLADDPLTILAASGATEAIRGTADELGGFFVIQAADSAEAFRIARDCPHLRHGGTVQVRRIEPT